MALLRYAFWGTLFLLCTFAWTVLFEHGPMNYIDDAKTEKTRLMELFGKKPSRKADASDSLTPPIR
jgi:hypothetical protein